MNDILTEIQKALNDMQTIGYNKVTIITGDNRRIETDSALLYYHAQLYRIKCGSSGVYMKTFLLPFRHYDINEWILSFTTRKRPIIRVGYYLDICIYVGMMKEVEYILDIDYLKSIKPVENIYFMLLIKRISFINGIPEKSRKAIKEWKDYLAEL